MMFPIYQKDILHEQKSTLGWISVFPDAFVCGKHSAWLSMHRRAEARTHYPQRNSAQKPPSGRKGDHEVVEGARVTCNLRGFYCHALSLSLLLRKIQLPPGGSLS